MKTFLSGLALFVLIATSASAQLVLPTRPAGVVTADGNVVTRFGPGDYLSFAPLPAVPASALTRGTVARGVYILDLSMLYGTVDDVRVLQSTGSKALDDAAAAALSRWVFHHYKVYKAAVPVEFDASGRVRIGADPTEGPYISEVLAYLSGDLPTAPKRHSHR
jgi:TonB family protein